MSRVDPALLRRLHGALKPVALALQDLRRNGQVLDGMNTDTLLALGGTSAALDVVCALLGRDIDDAPGSAKRAPNGEAETPT